MEEDTTLKGKNIMELKMQAEQQKLYIVKLKNKKNTGKRNICGYCNKDFEDKDNLNWSCVTHIGLWGGTMWWCCGKTKRTA